MLQGENSWYETTWHEQSMHIERWSLKLSASSQEVKRILRKWHPWVTCLQSEQYVTWEVKVIIWQKAEYKLSKSSNRATAFLFFQNSERRINLTVKSTFIDVTGLSYSWRVSLDRFTHSELLSVLCYDNTILSATT